MDYSTYDTYTTTTDAPGGFLAGMAAGLMLVYLALIVLMLVAGWKVFTKAKRPGWAILVPIYNSLTVLWIVGRPWWWLLLMCIPFVNIVFGIIVTNDLSKSFGKSAWWTVGLIFLPIVFYPMLAFGSAEYHGPAAAK